MRRDDNLSIILDSGVCIHLSVSSVMSLSCFTVVTSSGVDADGILSMAVLSEGDGWKASALIPAAAAAGLKNRRSGVAIMRRPNMVLEGDR